MRTIKSIVTKLSILLEKEEKKNLFLLLLLSVVSAFLEMLGVSMVVPLVSVIMDPAILTQEGVVLKLCSAFNISTHKDFVLLCVIGMIIVFVVKGLFLIATNYFRCGFVFNSRRKMQQKVLHAVIRKPYEFFLNTESGEIQRLIYNDVIYTYDVVMTLLSLISDSLVSLALILTIFFIDPIVTLMIAGFLAILLIVILKVIRPAVKDAGIKYRASTKGVYQWVIQIVHGIKEIMVAEREPLFEQKFAEAGKQHTEAERLYSVMNNVPKIFVEMGCICSALVIMAVMVASGRNPQTLVSAFAAFAMAAVKLMPAANRILTAANELSFRRDSLDKVLQILQNSDADMELFYRTEVSITLHREVELSHITYRYQGRKEEILSGASMIVPAGHSVGVIGPSGAGKTTAADILLGLLKPQKGQVLSDGTDVTENYQGWLDLVAYIPQTIFMMSGSIRENVAFGENESEEEKVWRALEEAQLADFVRGLPDGLDTQIGERGIRLSGGQRQRIGIARALYTDPQLLVFDEATSSLDNETESAIIGSINALHGKKTMVIIAHRLQTIENCDMVYRVPGDGSIIRER